MLNKIEQIIKNYISGKVISRLLTVIILAVFFIGFIFLSIQTVSAAPGIRQTINFQGKLVDDDGLNVADSTYSIIFTLYDASSGGSQLWQETRSVTTTNGIFREELGTSTSLSSVDFNSDSIYLGIKVGADAEMTPRVRFTATPYAFQAQNVPWSGLKDAAANLAVSMGSYTSTFTYGNSTGANDLFKLTDTTSNTGTGRILSVQSASGSTVKPFHVSAGGAEAILVDANGNVGIGTTNPTRKLDVNGTLRLRGQMYDYNNEVGTPGQVLSTTANGVDWIDAGSVGTDNQTLANVYSQAGNNVQLTGAYGDIRFYRGTSTEMLFLDESSGNVGIGTTNPTYKLSVNGSVEIVSGSELYSFGSATLGNRSYTTPTYVASGQTFTASIQALDDAVEGVISGSGGVWSRNAGSGYLFPQTLTDSVGIGTSTPTAKLQVVGNIVGSTLSDGTISITSGTIAGVTSIAVADGLQATPSYTFTNDSNTGFYRPASDSIGIGTSGVERIRVAPNGNVGIGTTNPGYRLDVTGDIRIANGSELYSFGSATLGNRTYTEDNYVVDGQTFTASIDALDQQLADVIGGAGGVWSRDIGNGYLFPQTLTDSVGIGTSVPSEKLHVVGNAIISGNITSGGIITGTGSGLTGLNASNLASGTVPSARISGDYSGITGVGTITSGTWQGSVISSTYLDSAVILSTEIDTSAELAGIIGDETGSGALVFANSPALVTPNIGAATGTSLNVTGAITAGGIITGTGSGLSHLNASNLTSGTVPDARIAGAYNNFTNITGSGNSQFANYRGGDGSRTAPSYSFTSDTNTGMYRIGNDILSFATAGSDRFTILAGGNVGIGTTNPTYKLSVNGSVEIVSGSELYSFGSATLGNRSYTTPTYVTSGQTFTASIQALDDAVEGVISGSGGVWSRNAGSGYLYPQTLTDSVGIGTSVPSEKLHVLGNAIISGNITSGGIITGTGSGLTGLNASNLASGTVPSARISGNYSGITGVGTITSGTWQGSVISSTYLDPAVILSTEIDTYAELNTIVSDVTLTHNGLIDTSAEIAGIVGDETGTGSLVFANSPTFAGNVLFPGSGIWKSTGDVGIGTTNPGAKLEVAGQVKITGGSPGANKVLTSDASGLATWQTLGAASIGDDSLDFDKFKDVMLLDTHTHVDQNGYNFSFFNTGNVGIGTSTPTAKLQVVGNIVGSTLSDGTLSITGGNITGAGNILATGIITGTGSGISHLNASNLTTGTVPDARIAGAYTNFTNITGSGTAQFGTFSAGNGSRSAPAYTFTSDTNTGMYRIGTDILSLATAGADRLTILAGGNVGIGTTNPGAKLEVAGQVKITGGSPGANKVLVSDASGLATWETLGEASITDDSLDFDKFRDNMTLDAKTTVNQAGFDFGFQGTGSVGIGTTSPSEKLHVLGNAIISGNITSGGIITGTGSGLTGLNASNLASGTVPSARISGNYSGITGVGTITSGTWQGSVISNTYLDPLVILSTEIDTYTELNTIVADVTLTHNGLIDTSAEIAGIVGDETGTGSLVFANSPALVTPNIGAATGTSLSLTGAITTGNGSRTAPSHSFASDTNTGMYRIGTDILGFATAGADRLTILANGSVGIGTTAPSNKLTVEGVSGGTGFSGSNGTGGVRVKWSTGYGVSLDAWDGGSPRWGITKFSGETPLVMMEGRYNSTDVLFLAGNVGIGKSNPAHKLDVDGNALVSGNIYVGTTDVQLSRGAANRLDLATGDSLNLVSGDVQVGGTSVITSGRIVQAADGSRTTPAFGFSADTNTGMYRIGNDILGLATAGNDRLTIFSNGNVGIGTTNPGAALEVAGQVKITGGSPGTNKVLVSDSTGLASWTTIGEASITDDSLDFDKFRDNMTLDAKTTINQAGYDFGFQGSGNLGIGTTNPSQRLEVAGNALFTTNIYVGTTDVQLSRGAANRLDLATGDSFNLVSGNLQIAGTTAIDSSRNANFATSVTLGGDVVASRGAANRLDLASGDSLNLVSGDVQVGGTSVITSGRLVQAENGSRTAPSFSFSADTNTGMYRIGTDILGLATAGADRLTILANGSVGIGTTTPGAALDVIGNIQLSGNISDSTDNYVNINDYLSIELGTYDLSIEPRNTWGNGATNYPTIRGSNVNEWIMLHNPHVPYLQNGVAGYTGTTSGAVIRLAANTAASTYWDVGIDSDLGTDTFGISRGTSNFLSIANNGTVTIPGTLMINGAEAASLKTHNATVTDGWYRIASDGPTSDGGTGGDTAYGRFVVWSYESGRHCQAEFTAGYDYSRSATSPTVILNSNNCYNGTDTPITAIRAVAGDTYEGAAVEVYIDVTTSASVGYQIYDEANASPATNGNGAWTPVDWTAGSVWTGAGATTVNIASTDAVIGMASGSSATDEFYINRNGVGIFSNGIYNQTADGELGASANFVFRDTGDSWLRLRTASGGSTYADLALGNLYVGGNVQNVGTLSFSNGANHRISSNASGLLFDGGDGTNWDFLVYNDNVYSDNLILGYSGQAQITTYDANENLIIDPNGTGLVAIGNGFTPTADLHIGGATTASDGTPNIPGVQISGGTGGWGKLELAGGAANTAGHIDFIRYEALGADFTSRIIQRSGSLNFAATAETNFSIRNDTGHVGIGTTSPAYPLDVLGNGRIRSNLYVGTSGNYLTSQPSGDYGSIQVNAGGKGGWEGYSIDGRAVFMHDGGTGTGLYNDVDNEWLIRGVHNSESYMYYNGAIRLTATSAGATISGNGTLTGSLTANSTITGVNNILSTSTGTASIQVRSTGGSGRTYQWEARSDGYAHFTDMTANQQRISITPGGLIGLNNNSPATYTLSVGGNGAFLTNTNNPSVVLNVTNANAGTNASTYLQLGNNATADGFILGLRSSTYSGGADQAYVWNRRNGQMNFGVNNNIVAAFQRNNTLGSGILMLDGGATHGVSYIGSTWADDAWLRVTTDAGSTYRDFAVGKFFSGTSSGAYANHICSSGTGSGTYGTCSSSIRYKENVKDFPAGLSDVMKLRPKKFNWKYNGQSDYGFIAEELEQINPDFVFYNDEGIVEGVKYDRLTAVLANAIQEQQAQITGMSAGLGVTGELALTSTQTGYAVSNIENNTVLSNTMGAYSVISAYLKAGSATATDLTVNGKAKFTSLAVTDFKLGGKTLNEYIEDSVVTGQIFTSLDDQLTAQETQITQLDLESNILSTSVASQSASLSTVTARLDQIEQATNNTEAVITSLQDRIAALETMFANNMSTNSAMLFTESSSATVSASIARAITDTEVIFDKKLIAEDDLTVLGKLNTSDIGVTGTISSGLLTINGFNDEMATPSATISTLGGVLSLQHDGMNGIEFIAGKVAIDVNGNVLVREGDVEIENGDLVLRKGSIKGSTSIRGIDVPVTAGATEITVTFTDVNDTDTYAISVLPTWFTNIIVQDKTIDGFKILFDRPAPVDATLDWLIVE